MLKYKFNNLILGEKLKKRLFLGGLILSLLFNGLNLNRVYANTVPKYSHFDRWVNKQLSHYHIHGASIAIIKNYKVVYEKGYGYANFKQKRLVTANTLFQVGSVTKPFTALATILTIEKGKLSLDNNVNKFLVSWKIPENQYTKQQKVTLRELLSHTAGVISEGYPGYCSTCKLPTLLQVLNGKSPAVNKPIRIVGVPGKEYTYSTPGYVIIQQLLVDVYKKPFASIMKTLVFEPLQMNSSTLKNPLPKELSLRAATPYDKNGQPVVGGAHIMVGSAAGGMWSTTPDLAKFIIAIQRALNHKDSPLSTKTATLMIKPVMKLKKNLAVSLAFDILENKQYNQTMSTYFMHTGQFFGFEAFIIGSETKGNGAVVLINSCFDRSTESLQPPFKPDQCSPNLSGNAISFRSLVIRHIAKMQTW